MAATPEFDAVFFDLDGTLVDTAPDMVAVLLDMQKGEGHELLAYELARSHVSNGAAGLIKLAFPGVVFEDHERLRLDFLDRYEKDVCINSAVFPGLDDLLHQLDAAGRPWGIVTNKPARMTEPLLRTLGIDKRAACMISGDSIAQRKPDPAPLLLAAQHAGVAAERCVYVGDAARDIEAGRAARMFTVAAAYGYIVPGDDPQNWNADRVVADADELADFLLQRVQKAC